MMDIEWKHFEELDSTSKWVKEHFNALAKDKITVVTAQTQTAGYGRRGHVWFSSPEDISLTLAFTIAHHKENLAQLITLSVLKVLESYGLKAQLKWPNDVMIKGKKISGAICETLPDEGIALGLGLNVNRESFEEIDQKATSLFIELGHPIATGEVEKKVVAQFASDLSRYKTGGFALFYREYDAHLYGKGSQVRIDDEGKKLIGTNEGIKEDGRLLLKDAEGHIHIVSSGTTTM